MRVFIFMITLLASAVGYAQQVTVNGKVLQSDGQPIEGAFVRVLNTSAGTVTDATGSFSLNLASGKSDILITAIGYADLNKIVTVAAGSNEALTFTLVESAIRLDDIVVTAEKEEGELLRVPYSISALSSRKVTEYRIWNSKDVTAIVPNLYSANPGDNRNVTSIRGITSSSYDPAVATYIDGVNQFSLDTYIAQLFDVERIEVLRGPQGTLYGRNAMGGVINIITKQPTNKTSGFAEANIGSYGQQRYSVGVRTPVVKNKLFLGASAMYDRSNGFYTNVFDNSDFDKNHTFLGNYYLTYVINPAWSITANVKHQQTRNDGAFSLAFGTEAAFESPFEVDQNAVTKLVDNVFNSSLKVNHAGDAVNFTSLTTYQSNYRYYKDPIDADFSSMDILTINNNYGKDWNNVKVWTQEFRLSSSTSSGSPLKWATGAYFFMQDNPVKQATHNSFSFSNTISTSESKNKGMAFYGQATYVLTDKFDVTGGLRYDYERKEMSVLVQEQADPDPDENPIVDIYPENSKTTSYNALSPKVSATYHVNENNHTYATFSRGFRTGGLTQQPPLYEYKPEFSNNLEVGTKNVFFDNRLSVNLAAFYIWVKDVQVPTLILPEAITVTRNAGELTSKGIELEVSAAVAKGLHVDYNLGLTHARYTKLALPVGEDVAPADMSGNRQIFTPSATSMLALQYSYDLGTPLALNLVARGEWMYLGEQYFDLANSIRQSGYSLFNARVGVTSPHFEIMFWARNLSDERYIAYAYDFGGVHLGNPRNWGVTLRKNF